MNTNKNYYYKVVSDVPENGTIINTADRIDRNMLMRLSDLNNLFELIYSCSEYHEISIKQIWLKLKAKNLILFTRNRLKSDLKNIKREIKKQNFILQSEFRYFTYYILEKARQDLIKTSGNIDLPNRFESSYFFGNLKDCIVYLIGFYGLSFKDQSNNLKIIEVEFERIESLHKFDNNLLTDFKDDFHSKDFYSTLKNFLLCKESEKPLFEYVFQGSYKIIRNDIEI
ncbi:hypothetical protein [Winogradskyella psychrotolerans]|uniref:hypothetical protein n=1 Tax=Winogradskyella psychrotolerans TaxID=1344585 RepID=UPI001C06F271|nr:hypothetical protein [Winogradskyella psychrotolerans]MBU2928024.1 hypothetical protein [Winogradskyella psychrotolerans]